MKKQIVAVMALLCIVLSACTSPKTKNTEENSLEAVMLEQDDYVVYEGIFLDNDKILSVFKEIRGAEAPYDIIPADYHVTTLFLPTEDAANYELYGQKVSVHIIGYKCGEIQDDDGAPTHNEGLSVEVSSDNEKMQAFLGQLNVNWHITGSSEKAAKYTGKLDFSDAEKLDVTIEGTYGAYLNSKVVTLNPVYR